jgi:molecular chaperone GrpE
MLELLPVLDHADLAIAAARTHEAENSVVEGFRLVTEQLTSALRKFNVIPIDVGAEDFDPQKHEAVSHLPSEQVPANKVMAQVRRGYTLGNKLLRPVQVVVSSGKPAATPEPVANEVAAED